MTRIIRIIELCNKGMTQRSQMGTFMSLTQSINSLATQSLRKKMGTNQSDIVKLKLRGKGSGFKEGPNMEESKEPLSITVVSMYYDKYLIACNHVQELILNVYEEYKAFCAKYQRKPNKDFDLQIKKEEMVTRPMPIPEVPPHVHESEAIYDELMAVPEEGE
uniref:KHDC4/BBP-like KH-domain type I domain-containing protein n=1 Tax=Strombidium inclinatum TaxID=197538 RepID=A0A7S3IXF0_9SPIT|mmetsp:Transcript_7713/g.11961  ORF Transcript_7713/g.11961 Transcript_7713/m.11961 type:complete len:162 (+) Transcript_7713:779-1264(+)